MSRHRDPQPPLSIADFAPAFQALWGHEPFPWQSRLVEELAGERLGLWPDTLDLPTGSGKTAALDIALFHLALEAGRPLDQRRAPLRIALVVDRRLIVDDVHGRAQTLAQRLLHAQKHAVDTPLGRWAQALQALAGPEGSPVQAVRLRGGVPLEAGWASSPTQPLLISATVDQIGSRLLFRGYGVSDRMAPVHAGLVGADMLVLLDEAHLAEPFRQSLGWVCRHRAPGATPFQTAQLTATPGGEPLRPFALAEDDREHPVLRQRLEASKPARLEATGQPLDSDKLVHAFVQAAHAELDRLQMARPDPALAVVVNRVALARRIFEAARMALPEAVVELLIGPARPLERDALASALAPLKTGARGEPRDRPTVLIATQSIEAGVDLDLDGLITQACPLDALRQRAGRINRSGRAIDARIVILAAREDLGNKPDPVYGDRTRTTWERLEALGEGLDLGITALTQAIAGQDLRAVITHKTDAPVMMPAYVDLWRQTWPRPLPDPEVGLFLHGAARDLGSVQVLWRGDLQTRDGKELIASERLRALLALAPPSAQESIALPVWTVRAWLNDDVTDVTLADIPTEGGEDRTEDHRGRRAFRWRGADHEESRWIGPEELRPGDVVVVPSDCGGCDSYGWAPHSQSPVSDLGLQASRHRAHRRLTLRLHPGLLNDDPGGVPEGAPVAGDATAGLRAAARRDAFLKLLAEQREAPRDRLLEALRPWLAPQLALLNQVWAVGTEVPPGAKVLFAYDEDGAEAPTGVVLHWARGVRGLDIGSRRVATPLEDDPGDLAATEDDTQAALGVAAQAAERDPARLDLHTADVVAWVTAMARSLRLNPALASDLALAAQLHDLGKIDPRFQILLAGGTAFAWDGVTLRAKSPPGQAPAPRRPDRPLMVDDLPPGWRHEVLSVQLAPQHPAFATAEDPALVLWLIGTHHGFGRPFFAHLDPLDSRLATAVPPLPAVDGMVWQRPPVASPASLAFDWQGLDWAGLFQALSHRYGAWDLAWLESLLRLADHRASALGRGPLTADDADLAPWNEA